MDRYIVFIRKVRTGEEFVSARRAAPNTHMSVLEEVRMKYPHPEYQVLTAYTEAELKDIMDSVQRWCGASEQHQMTEQAGSVFQA